ncbi:uncharacterized protein LOC130641277 [Hydractinia symbiolongicarpus]|uniref:uncharacterized protein LOC130641277 n=1 Tax=Hydractinia symbiolongicarpus TaxID=13093 RepID=UPI00254BD24D|nr:uncharacterized protein LOC130641277 [Hydractinia symbiolongicarpus]
MVKAEQPWEVRRGEEEVKGKPSEEDQDGGKSEATEKGEHENLKSCLNKKKTQIDQLEGQQMLDTDEAVNNNKARKVSFSDEVSYCEDFTLIKTNKRQKFHSFRKATIIIDKKKTVLVKSMRKLIEKHKTTKLELLEEKEAVAVKIAEVELLKLVLSGKEVELREKEKEISCIKAGVIDIKVSL